MFGRYKEEFYYGEVEDEVENFVMSGFQLRTDYISDRQLNKRDRNCGIVS